MYVIQGILFSTPDCIKTPVDLVKLWLHEASRVYEDKLIDTKDIETFQKLKLDIAKAGFEVITKSTSTLNSRYLYGSHGILYPALDDSPTPHLISSSEVITKSTSTLNSRYLYGSHGILYPALDDSPTPHLISSSE